MKKAKYSVSMLTGGHITQTEKSHISLLIELGKLNAQYQCNHVKRYLIEQAEASNVYKVVIETLELKYNWNEKKYNIRAWRRSTNKIAVKLNK